MKVRLRGLVVGFSALGLAAGAPSLAAAQDQPRWVDPPAAGGSPPAPEPAPSAPRAEIPAPAPRAPAPVESAEPRQPAAPPARTDTAETERMRREASAQQFLQDYLGFWSAPNHVALEAHRDFYAPTVDFHGRERSARSVMDEKRATVRRWPERNYRPRPDTIEAACDLGSDLCTVRSRFDFSAADPNRGRRSEGSGSLELVVSFAGRDPVIVSETSDVTRRGQDRTVSLEELAD